MIADWHELKVGSKFTYHASRNIFEDGDEGEVVSIDSNGWGVIKNLTNERTTSWNYNSQVCLSEMTLINPEPLVFKPFRSSVFVSSTAIYRYAGD